MQGVGGELCNAHWAKLVRLDVWIQLFRSSSMDKNLEGYNLSDFIVDARLSCHQRVHHGFVDHECYCCTRRNSNGIRNATFEEARWSLFAPYSLKGWPNTGVLPFDYSKFAIWGQLNKFWALLHPRLYNLQRVCYGTGNSIRYNVRASIRQKYWQNHLLPANYALQ